MVSRALADAVIVSKRRYRTPLDGRDDGRSGGCRSRALRRMWLFLAVACGVIIGTALKYDRTAPNPLDPQRAGAFFATSQ